MFMSIATRRLLKSSVTANAPLFRAAQRSMSTLLVPLEQRPELPAELGSYELTTRELTDLEKSFKEFNASALEQLKEMNENKITNIIERGGVDNWITVSTSAIRLIFVGSRSLFSQENFRIRLI